MDAMDADEFQEADILWPDTVDELVPFAPMDMEELYEAGGGSVSSAAPPVFSRRHFEGSFLSGRAGPSSFSAGGASPGAEDDEEWQEADVLWPDTATDEPRESGGWPFSAGASGSGRSRAGRRVVTPVAAARRDGWTTASSPIDIPANVVAPRCRLSRLGW